MCLYLNSEVILANILSYYPRSYCGVDIMLIEQYCMKIKELLINDANRPNFIFFQILEGDIEKDISSFSKHFGKFMGRYYKESNFDLEFFNNRCQNIDNLRNIFYEAALKL